jgi:hypothetical protein
VPLLPYGGAVDEEDGKYLAEILHVLSETGHGQRARTPEFPACGPPLAVHYGLRPTPA